MALQVLFVHGMWSRPGVWDAWRERFGRAGFDSRALTLPGHGVAESDPALRRVGLADYASAVEAAVRSCAAPPILIGHSLGGLITQQVAARVSLAAAVLVNSAAPAPIFPLRPIVLPGLARHFTRWDLWRRSFRLSRREADHLLFNAMPESRHPSLYSALTAESGRVLYQVGFGALNVAGSNRVERRAIDCPLLALAGVRDHIIPIGVSRRLAAWYGSRLDYREYPTHAHWMLGEPGWELRADETIEWLSGLEHAGGRRGAADSR